VKLVPDNVSAEQPGGGSVT